MGDRGWCAYFDAEEAAARAKYGDPDTDEGGDAPRCRLCGERIFVHDERAEVAITVPMGDDEVVEHALVHAACYSESDWEVRLA